MLGNRDVGTRITLRPQIVVSGADLDADMGDALGSAGVGVDGMDAPVGMTGRRGHGWRMLPLSR